MTDQQSSSGSAVAWRWRTLPKFSEDAADQEWSLSSTEPNFINAHHHEVEPLYVTAAQPPTEPVDITGWKLVPDQSTEAMWQAGRSADIHLGDSYSKVWSAMFDAAPDVDDCETTSSVPSTTRATGPLVPWELDCQRAVCAAPECECPALPSTKFESGGQ